MTNMTMTYEYISPDYAELLLKSNENNRKLSKGTVKAYSNDIKSGNWSENTGDSISIDTNGKLVNGQHRLSAIVDSGIGIHTWVCRNVVSDGIYDNNRKRSVSDQLIIAHPEIEKIYKSTLYVSVARKLIDYKDERRRMSPKEIINFTEEHKIILDGYFLNIAQNKVSKVNICAVHTGLFLAYQNGIDIKKIQEFYKILCSGMSSEPIEYPIIAYRNYLMKEKKVSNLNDEIARCQYALYKYLTKSCTKKTSNAKGLIYPYIWVNMNK